MLHRQKRKVNIYLTYKGKGNSLRMRSRLSPGSGTACGWTALRSVQPERMVQRRKYEMDDLLPWSEEMKPWFPAVCVLRTTALNIGG